MCVSSSGSWLNKGGGSSERWQGPPEQSTSLPPKAAEGARGIQDGTTGPQNAQLSLIHGLRSLVSSEGHSHSVETQRGHPDTESKGLGSKGSLSTVMDCWGLSSRRRGWSIPLQRHQPPPRPLWGPHQEERPLDEDTTILSILGENRAPV